MNTISIILYVLSVVFFLLSWVPSTSSESSRKLVEISALFAIAGGVA